MGIAEECSLKRDTRFVVVNPVSVSVAAHTPDVWKEYRSREKDPVCCILDGNSLY